MIQVCPTITATDGPRFNQQVELVNSTGAERIHLDLMDGVFAPTKSPEDIDNHGLEDKVLDIHVMHKQPALAIQQLLKLQPNLVIVHAESSADVPLIASELREKNIKTGLAVLPQTTIESIASWLPHVQHLLIFGGNLGYHGGIADLGQLRKVQEARLVARHLEYGWDGGANAENIKTIAEAGVSVVNVGSYIHTATDPKKAFENLNTILG